MGCSSWGDEESDTTDDFTFTFHFHALEKEMATHSGILFFFFFYFILLYNTVLVLPYIDMNPPRVYMRSQT